MKKKAARFDFNFKFQKSKLSNGLTLVTESLAQFQSLSIGVWVKAGTRDESPAFAGMSHFLEHMMFKGTKSRSALDIALAIDRVGGEFNAFTTREYTCFHLLILSKDLELGMEIISDVLKNSIFSADEIERERNVILQEISMIEDNPEETIHDLFMEQAYPHHPLGTPILGPKRNIERFKRKDVLDFFQHHYAPEKMVLAVTGNVDHEEVKKLAKKNLTGLKTYSKPKTKALIENEKGVPELHPGISIYPRNFEQSHVILGFPGIPYFDEDRFAAFLLNIYLGGGMSSTLFQEIREKRGLAYSVYANLAPFADTGIFSIYVATHPDHVLKCIEVSLQEIKKVLKYGIKPQYLRMLKDNLIGTVLLNSDSVENRMNSIAKNEMFFEKYFSTEMMITEIEKIKLEDVLKVAKRILDPQKMIATVLGPHSKIKTAKKIKAMCLN